MRNISFALTTTQILDQSKDVTRRLGWQFLQAGDLLQPVKKCMGLRPGETVQRLGHPIRVVSLRRERLDRMVTDPAYGREEVRREGFAHHPEFSEPAAWVAMFCATHKGCSLATDITRIEFAYTTSLGPA
ncbi:hypothetical protein P3G55_22340 [Leptospira sp. 96542]|nr:hypothetical protein [Leptospira sp. 96542]